MDIKVTISEKLKKEITNEIQSDPAEKVKYLLAKTILSACDALQSLEGGFIENGTLSVDVLRALVSLVDEAKVGDKRNGRNVLWVGVDARFPHIRP